MRLFLDNMLITLQGLEQMQDHAESSGCLTFFSPQNVGNCVRRGGGPPRWRWGGGVGGGGGAEIENSNKLLSGYSLSIMLKGRLRRVGHDG